MSFFGEEIDRVEDSAGHDTDVPSAVVTVESVEDSAGEYTDVPSTDVAVESVESSR